MVRVAFVGIVAMAIQQFYIWRASGSLRAALIIGEHFPRADRHGESSAIYRIHVGRGLMPDGPPEHVLQPCGMGRAERESGSALIIYFTLKDQTRQRAHAIRRAPTIRNRLAMVLSSVSSFGRLAGQRSGATTCAGFPSRTIFSRLRSDRRTRLSIQPTQTIREPRVTGRTSWMLVEG